jgi:hypothetical protein
VVSLFVAGAGAGGSWAQEFADNEADFADWDSIYARNAEAGVSAGAAVGDGEYVFSEHNPFLGDAAAFEKGKDLFKRGLLSEAALALEAEVSSGCLGFCPVSPLLFKCKRPWPSAKGGPKRLCHPLASVPVQPNRGSGEGVCIST